MGSGVSGDEGDDAHAGIRLVGTDSTVEGRWYCGAEQDALSNSDES